MLACSVSAAVQAQKKNQIQNSKTNAHNLTNKKDNRPTSSLLCF